MKIKDLIINSDFYVAFVALGMGMLVYAMYGMPFLDLTPLVIVFLVTLNVYAMNRQVDEEFDKINVPERTKFLRVHGKRIFFASLVGLGIALALGFARSFETGAATLLAFLCGYFYSYPFPKIGRFRDFFIIKNIGASMIYGFLALITLLYFGKGGIAMLSFFFVLFFLRFLLITSFFDLRDIEGDAKAGLRTLPIAMGRERMLQFFHVINVLPVLLFLILPVEREIVAFSLISAAYGFAYIHGAKLGLDMEFLCMVVADAEFFVASLVMLALKAGRII